MNFKSMVAPLAALGRNGPESMVGSGFLIQVDGQIYLVTVAHLATGNTSQVDDWSRWADEITLHNGDQAIMAKVSLFDVDDKGAKVPRFKFVRTRDMPQVIADIILLPLSPEDPMTRMSEIFHLPDAMAPYKMDDSVIMAGCRPWPAISTRMHVLTGSSIPVLHVHPGQVNGYSGCPVVNSAGRLVGMAYGSGNDLAPGDDHGLVLAVEVILAVTGTVDGFVDAS